MFLFVRSGNQDPQSWFHSREDNVLVDDPEETQRVVKLLLEPQQSLQHCYHDYYGEKEDFVDDNSSDIPDPIDPEASLSVS